MANIRTCNKHNMIACVEKTEHNADFHQIVDYLTGCSINYSLLVDPDLIGPWLQQFWATASLRSINEVPHIRAMVAGKREGGVADYNNMDPTIDVPSTPTLRIHKIHPQSQIIGKSTAGVQTRRKLQDSTSNQHQALLSFIYKQNRTNHKDQQTCLFACFLSQEEPKKVSQALADESWVEAMQEELLQFKLQEVWVLCDLPEGKRVIGTKWVFRNKRDERGTIIKNKARLVAQGYRQEEGVDYDEVFAPVARIEAIRLFLAFASFMGFIVYQMDVKSAFLYGNITEEVYVKQPPGFEDPAHPNKVYRVVKALYGLHQAPRAWYERLSTFLLKHGYRRGAIDKTLFIKKDRRDIMLVQVYVDDIIFGSTKSSMVKDFEDLMQKEFKMSSMGELTFFLGLQVKQTTAGIFLSQDKYVKDILNKFDFRTIKPASTPIEAHKSLGKDEEGEDVDVHLYRFQVTLKVSHLHAVKRIFRYLKHQPQLGLWYPKDSPFHFKAFSDSDYTRDNHDRRSTSGGCQYLGRRLVSWQCKKQTIVAISSTEAEYVAAASCCAQVLWMQNQFLDYGFNFMNTEIHIDNESTICIVKNPVLHSKTKHIQIRHHFIRDCYEQRLINVVTVHTDDNVADLLTKGFDLARFNFLVVSIDYYKHIPPTGLGLILLGDLTTIWETSATKLEDGTMIHMLTEKRYPLSRELMIRMLDHGMEVEDESETAITLIHLFILWTTKDGDDS
ncbi:putative ribonuclease H-like domain-containing protein [Tanacetum coccineum]